jgi:hypothetical protein
MKHMRRRQLYSAHTVRRSCEFCAASADVGEYVDVDLQRRHLGSSPLPWRQIECRYSHAKHLAD